MTSISSTTPWPDPRAQMDARISAAAATGAISTDDQDALSSALDTIDSSLSASSGAKPGDMKDKIDGLIDAQVKSGALTDEQAGELKSFFAQGPDGDKQGGAQGAGSPQGAGGAHHAHHAHGGGGSKPATEDTDDDSTDTATQISEAATRQLDAMTAFLQKLRDTAASGSSTYGNSAGTTSNGSSATGMVIDTKA